MPANCIGVITEIDSTEVWFEFSDPESKSDCLGFVKIEDLVGKSENLKVGDRIRCTVEKLDEGDESNWVATYAELVQTGSEQAAPDEDVIMLEDQTDRMFDQDQEEDEDKPNIVEEPASNGLPTQADTKPAQTTSSATAKAVSKPVKPVVFKEEPFFEKCVLYQLVKPLGTSSRTIVGVFAILTGPLQGQAIAVPCHKIKVWGYSLTRVSLVYYMNYGDEGIIQYKWDKRQKTTVDRLVYIGPKDLEKPANASTNPDFAEWLKKRKLSEGDFLKWVNNDAAIIKRPYFPLTCFTYSAKVIGIAWDNQNVGIGAFVQIGNLFSRPNPCVVRHELCPRDVIAFLRREDFYMCGVAVGKANLCYLLWPDNSILVQVNRLSWKMRQELNPLLAQRPDLEVEYHAYFGVLGPNRPKDQVLDPKQSKDLPAYLKRKKLTLADFESMIAGTFQPPQPAEAVPALMDMTANENWQQFGRSISKIQTEHGLVLSTRKALEAQEVQLQAPARPNYVIEHTPSKKIEADFLATKRLQDFRDDVRPDEPSQRGHVLVAKDEAQWNSEEFKVVQKILTRYLDIKSVDDPKIMLMFDNQNDVRIVTKMTAILTKALAFAIDKHDNLKPDAAMARAKRPAQSELRHEEPKRSRPMEDEQRRQPRDYADHRYEAVEDYRGRSQPHSYGGSKYENEKFERPRSRERLQPSASQKYDDFGSPSQSYGRYDDQYGRPQSHSQPPASQKYDDMGRYPGDPDRAYPGPSGYGEDRRREAAVPSSKPLDHDRYYYDHPPRGRTPPPAPRHAPDYPSYEPRGRSPPELRVPSDKYRSVPPTGVRPAPDRYAAYDKVTTGVRAPPGPSYPDSQKRGSESWERRSRSPPRYEVNQISRDDLRRLHAPAPLAAAATPINPFYSAYDSRPREQSRPVNSVAREEEDPRRYSDTSRREYADPRQYPDSKDRYVENPFRQAEAGRSSGPPDFPKPVGPCMTRDSISYRR